MKIWQSFPRLAEVVRKTHDEHAMQATGHPFDHVIRAAQYAWIIAEDEEMGRLAGAAGFCHNADRILQKILGLDKKSDVPRERVVDMVSNWLSTEDFAESQKAVILDAIFKHPEVNKPDDGPVLVILKDADRLTCADAVDIMAAAQFFKELPVLDPKWLMGDPSAHAYRNPKSVLRNLECRFEWFDPSSKVCVRLPKAKELMKRRVDAIKWYIEEVIAQRREIGLVPYPEF